MSTIFQRNNVSLRPVGEIRESEKNERHEMGPVIYMKNDTNRAPLIVFFPVHSKMTILNARTARKFRLCMCKGKGMTQKSDTILLK